MLIFCSWSQSWRSATSWSPSVWWLCQIVPHCLRLGVSTLMTLCLLKWVGLNEFFNYLTSYLYIYIYIYIYLSCIYIYIYLSIYRLVSVFHEAWVRLTMKRLVARKKYSLDLSFLVDFYGAFCSGLPIVRFHRAACPYWQQPHKVTHGETKEVSMVFNVDTSMSVFSVTPSLIFCQGLLP